MSVVTTVFTTMSAVLPSHVVVAVMPSTPLDVSRWHDVTPRFCWETVSQ